MGNRSPTGSAWVPSQGFSGGQGEEERCGVLCQASPLSSRSFLGGSSGLGSGDLTPMWFSPVVWLALVFQEGPWGSWGKLLGVVLVCKVGWMLPGTSGRVWRGIQAT